MKLLYVTTIGGTMRFFSQLIKELVEAGHTVDIAANTNVSCVPYEYTELGCKVFNLSCTRNPLEKGTLTAIGQLKKIVFDGDYDLVHCHTPIAAMCTRIACRGARKTGTKVIYTAHGFHFYKGAPLKNWLLYYPVEKICAHFTDVLITINEEDYSLAQKKLKAKRVEYVPGVGIDADKFSKAIVNRDKKRDEIGVPRDAVVILSVGDLNHNKNHELIIRALAKMKNLNIHYVVAGKGTLREYLIALSKELDIMDRVHLLGFRTDMPELYKSVDLYALPSIREGLNVSLMEAMAAGLPVVCSKVRGNSDLIDENSGSLFDPQDVMMCIKAIEHIIADVCDYSKKVKTNDCMRIAKGKYNSDFAKRFDVKQINEKMKDIYGI